jgi:RES domain-containing protein
MLAPNRLASALTRAKLISTHGPWTRAIAYRHLLPDMPRRGAKLRPLWAGAAPIRGARFTPQGGDDALYLASDSLTALAEVQALAFLAGGHFQPLTPPWVLVSVDGVVSRVLDLTDAATRKLCGTTEQELSGAWDSVSLAPTQWLGHMAREAGHITGIRYPSARNRGGGVNLVVFPHRLPLTRTDYLEVFDPEGNLQQRLGAA